ncbi:MAG: sensor histidine kinase [Gaiellaceae bacterium]|jgi:signal transduction histidine kinase
MAEPEHIDPFEELRIGFTAAVSHELRTPLARLLALLDSATLPAADTQALVAQAREEVEAMAELVDDVLFLSELETGRAVVGLGDVRIAPIVDEVVAALQPSAERHGQEFVTLVAEGVTVAVRPRMLRVLVENLLANAIRYAGDGARVTVSARTEGDVVLLSVADNGRGVPRGELPRLFERFFRGDRARTTHGSGLGLAIVKHVVTQAGGDVEARPGPGGLGLEVRCTFPR